MAALAGVGWYDGRFHTMIARGSGISYNSLFQMHLPHALDMFDSHRPLHFQLANASQRGFQPRIRQYVGRRWLVPAVVSHPAWIL
jgi:hypothetical protein